MPAQASRSPPPSDRWRFLTVTLLAIRGTGDDPALAHSFPANCDAPYGAASASIDAPGTIPPVVEGQIINYRLRVQYPDIPTEVLCQAFNVDVWIKLPGETNYTFVCNIATIDEGESPACPLVPYTADGDHRISDLLMAPRRPRSRSTTPTMISAVV